VHWCLIILGARCFIGGPDLKVGKGTFINYMCYFNTVGSVTIGNGCWICTRAIILPGVKIGDGCIIAAGSVVTEDCEPNYLYAGVPVVKIRYLN